jgi:hypothetical protein
MKTKFYEQVKAKRKKDVKKIIQVADAATLIRLARERYFFFFHTQKISTSAYILYSNTNRYKYILMI